MFNGLKGRRRLALYVALGLSAGSGVFMDASAAYASDVTIPSTDTAHGAGINGTAETGRKDGNNVTIGETGAAGPAINGDVVGGYAAAGDTANNTVTIRSMIALDPGKAVYGGRSDTGSATGNAVRIVGGHMTNVYGGYTAGAGRVQNNAVTVTGGTVHGHITAGASAGMGAVSGNTIHLGDESHRDLSAAALTDADLRGAETGGSASGNILAVNAKGAAVKSVDRFDTYRFNLGDAIGAGDTMLQVVNAGAFDPAGNGVSLENIKIGSIDQHGRGSVTLLQGQAATQLKFDASVRELAATLTHELELRTDSGMNTANALLLHYNRFNGSRVTHDGRAAAVSELYGGLSRTGHTTTDNALTVTGLATDLAAAFGGKNEGAGGDVTKNHLTITGTDEPAPPNTVHAIALAYGGAIMNAANAGTVGGAADGMGNVITIAGGTVNNVYGGYSAGSGAVEGNAVTITGGTIGNSVTDGSVYGGYAANGTARANTVTLGGADGTYAADLVHANIYGDNAAANAENGNTLNVRAKNIAVKSVQNFDNYTFQLNPLITDQSTMLTIGSGGFGREIDWNKLTVENLPDLQGRNPGGRITLVRGDAAGALKFKTDSVRRNNSTSDTEYVLETDTAAREAQEVLLIYAKFKNNTWAYNGTNPADTNEVSGGISYMDGSDTEGNTLAVTGVPAANLNAVYGGKTNGAAHSKNNRVLIYSTNVNPSSPVQQGQITNAYGGYTAAASGAAEGNEVHVYNGQVGTVYGGMAGGAANGNSALVYGGTVTNVYGGSAAAATQGTASENHVTVAGGTVSGQIAGGRSYDAAQNSRGNVVTLGAWDGSAGPNIAGAAVYGTSYYDTANSRELILANDSDRIAGNTLHVAAADITASSIRNFEKLNFTLADSFKDGRTMLTLSDEGGFGTVTDSGDQVRMKWENLTADTAGLSAQIGAGIQGRNTITLLQTLIPGPPPQRRNDLRFSGYTETAYADVDRVYEKKLLVNSSAVKNGADVDANAVLLELNRYKDGTVTHDGSTSPAEVYGGYSAYDDTKQVNGQHIGHMTENNTLSITGVATGTNRLKAYGGYTGGAQGGAVGNMVHVDVTNAAPGQLDSVYGGYTKGAGVVRGNTLRFLRGETVHDLMGGYIDSTRSDAAVEGNSVLVEGGSVGGTVYGGYTKGTGDAARNTVTLRGADVGGDVIGGYRDTMSTANARAANNNTISLYGTHISGTIYGGAAKNNANEKVANGVGNTLAVRDRGTRAADFTGVQNLHFYIPEGTTADPAAATMLRLTDAAYLTDGKKDLSNVNVGVQLAGSRPTLSVGDTVSLMKAYKVDAGDSRAVEITSNTPLVNNTTGMQGVSLRYNFDLLTREAQNEANANTTNPSHLSNELIAQVTNIELNEQTKSLVETRAAATAMINSSIDFLADNGFRAAEEAISAGLAGAQASVSGGSSFQMWAAQGGSSIRLNSGSHVDTKGWNLNLGFAKQKTAGRNTVTYGPLLEYGRSTYDSYLDDGTHGDGKMSYFGAGVMAKSKNVSGAYVEGSVRVGRVKSDYAGTVSGIRTGYDNSSTYYAAHIGVGQEKELKGGNKIETYAKYFYSHQGGNTTKLHTGETYDFDAVNSHRIKVGSRYTKKFSNRSEFYTGLAYEYEFGSDAGATYLGYSTPSPSLKGGTGLLELGYQFAPQDGRVRYGVNLMGMTGKRRGLAGSVQINWAF